jgi:hypothetical protein
MIILTLPAGLLLGKEALLTVDRRLVGPSLQPCSKEKNLALVVH